MAKRSAKSAVNRDLGVWNLLIPVGRAAWFLLQVVGAGFITALQLVGELGTLVFSFGDRPSNANDLEHAEQVTTAAGTAAAVNVAAAAPESVEMRSEEAEIFGPRRSSKSVTGGAGTAESYSGPMRKSGVSGSDLIVADRHLTKKIGVQTIHFAMYLQDGKVTRHLVKASGKHELAPFLRESAAADGVPFTLNEAVKKTERELSAARSRSSRAEKKRAKSTSSVQRRDDMPAATGPIVDVEPYAGEAPPWLEAPAFEDLPPAQAIPAAAGGSGDRLAQPPSPVKMVEREHPVDWRGGVRFVGEVISAGIVQCHPVDKKPYKIFSMTLRSTDGETKEFRGVELNELVTKHFIRRGDVVSLKRGRQEFEVTEDGQTKSRTRNVYDFRLVNRGPEPGIPKR